MELEAATAEAAAWCNRCSVPAFTLALGSVRHIGGRIQVELHASGAAVTGSTTLRVLLPNTYEGEALPEQMVSVRRAKRIWRVARFTGVMALSWQVLDGDADADCLASANQRSVSNGATSLPDLLDAAKDAFLEARGATAAASRKRERAASLEQSTEASVAAAAAAAAATEAVPSSLPQRPRVRDSMSPPVDDHEEDDPYEYEDDDDDDDHNGDDDEYGPSRRGGDDDHDDGDDSKAEARSATGSGSPGEAVRMSSRRSESKTATATATADRQSAYSYEEAASREVWLQEHELRRRLRANEEESRRLAERRPLHPSAKHVRSLFSSEQAGTILINELMRLRSEGPAEGILAEPIDFDMYRWNVQLRDFPPSCELARGLRRLSDIACYDYVELQLSFPRAIYPFFPPSVQLIRPRLAGDAMWRVMNISALRLDTWRPVRERGMLDVCLAIKEQLADWAVVDYDSPLSSLDRLSGAYSELERLLSQLLVLTDVPPRAGSYTKASDAELVARLRAGQQVVARSSAASSAVLPKSVSSSDVLDRAAADGTKSASSSSSKAQYWARGTGFSTGGVDKGWDPKAYLAAQAEKDSQLMMCFRMIDAYMDARTPGSLTDDERIELAALEMVGTSDSISAPSSAAGSSADSGATIGKSSSTRGTSGTSWVTGGLTLVNRLRRGPSHAPAAAAEAAAESDSAADSRASLMGVPWLYHLKQEQERYAKVALLKSDTESREMYSQLSSDAGDQLAAVMSIVDRPELRDHVVESAFDTLAGSCVLPALAAQMENSTLLDMERHRMLNRVLLSIVRRLTEHPRLIGLLAIPARSSDPEHASPSIIELLRRKHKQAKIAPAAAADPVQLPYDLLQDIITTLDAATDALARAPTPAETVVAAVTAPAAAAAAAASSSASAFSEDPSEAEYCAALHDLRYEPLPIPRLVTFHYASDADAVATSSSRKRTRHITLEHSTLAESLPLSRSSSVFVRFAEARLDCLRAIIIGPEDTPYSGGAFVFDIFLPSNYPEVPPKVNLLTTGGGHVRFNPNLYACGKVCLSLLGTWAGEKGESWEPGVSTLNQVLISIQSLIMVPDPYFNEPGYQRTMHTDSGKRSAFLYADERRAHTMQLAIADQIRSPPTGFEEPLRRHFRMRKGFLLRQADDWVRASREASSSFVSAMERAAKEVRDALATL